MKEVDLFRENEGYVIPYGKFHNYVTMCAPHEDYPEPPKDYSRARLVRCPDCDRKMWITIKKLKLIRSWKSFNANITINCFYCIENKFLSGEFKPSEILVSYIS